MSMKEYCKTCPDRGSELCVIPSVSQRVGRRVRWIAAETGGLMVSLATSDPESFGVGLRESRDVIVNERLGIDACIRAHTGEIVDSI